jgi:hypothetical protein
MRRIGLEALILLGCLGLAAAATHPTLSDTSRLQPRSESKWSGAWGRRMLGLLPMMKHVPPPPPMVAQESTEYVQVRPAPPGSAARRLWVCAFRPSSIPPTRLGGARRRVRLSISVPFIWQL